MRHLVKLLLLFLFSTSLWANNVSEWYTQQSDKSLVLNVSLFLSSTCSHCHKADAFFKQIEATTPWLHVQRYVIDKDKNALIRFNQLLMTQKNQDFAVPSIFFCNSRWVGFGAAETTGQELLRGLNYCKEQLEKKSELTLATVEVLNRWANADLFTSSMVHEPSDASYIAMMALMDAINPCAIFCLMCFLGLLFIQHDQRLLAPTGLLFMLAVGLTHYIQQTHPDAFFSALSLLRIPALLVGLVGIYFTYYCYRKQLHATLFWFIALLLPLVVQAYQQSCVMNWSYIFQQWLLNQQYNDLTHNLYQLAYQTIYLSVLGLVLAVYLFYTSTRWFKQHQVVLHYIGLLLIATTSLCLVFYPIALSYLTFSWLVFLGSLFSGWIINKRRLAAHLKE